MCVKTRWEGVLNKLHCTALTRQDLQHGVVKTVHQPSCHQSSSDPRAPGSEKSEGKTLTLLTLPHIFPTKWKVKSEGKILFRLSSPTKWKMKVKSKGETFGDLAHLTPHLSHHNSTMMIIVMQETAENTLNGETLFAVENDGLHLLWHLPDLLQSVWKVS